MSIAIMIVPMLFDLAVLTSTLMEENKRATVNMRKEKGLLFDDNMHLDVDYLRQSGLDIRSGTAADTHGADMVIHTDKGYDIGLRRNDAGAYDIVTHWSQEPGKAQIQQVRTDIESQIKQRYAYEKVRRELAKNGFMIASEEVQADNSIRVVARKW